jgi:methionyl-tRNA formyltransferase
MGVAALVEVAEGVVAGKAPALAQYEPDATYEGIIRVAESHVRWANLVDITYNLIRGCDPAPGAWTMHEGRKLFLYDARKRIARTFSEVKGKKIGQVVAQTEAGLIVHGQGGFIEIGRIRPEGGRKVPAAEAGVPVGAILGE